MTTKRLPVLFLNDVVLLPGMVVPIELDESAQAAVDAAAAGSDDELLVAPRLEDRYASYGVVAAIEKVGKFRGGESAAVLRTGRAGPHRQRRHRSRCGPVGRGRGRRGAAGRAERAVELAAEYKKLVVAVLQKREAWQIVDTVNAIDDPATLADTAGWAPYLSMDRKRQLLETPDVEERLTLLIEWTRDYLAEADVNEKISEDVRESVEKNQREFLLRQQLAAIRKELGEDEPRRRPTTTAPGSRPPTLPDHVREALLREVDKLERSSDQNPEAGWIRTWLDTVLELPWRSPRPRLHRHRRRPRRARRGPPRPRRGQGADRGVPRASVPVAPRAASRSSAAAAAVPSYSSPARPESARPRSASPSRARSAASSSGSRSAASATRPRSAATGGRTSERCPAASCARSRRPAR